MTVELLFLVAYVACIGVVLHKLKRLQGKVEYLVWKVEYLVWRVQYLERRPMKGLCERVEYLERRQDPATYL